MLSSFSVRRTLIFTDSATLPLGGGGKGIVVLIHESRYLGTRHSDVLVFPSGDLGGVSPKRQRPKKKTRISDRGTLCHRFHVSPENSMYLPCSIN